MRGFETLLAASVATAGVAQIAVMVARTPHVDAVSVEPLVATCCQYRTWPVEHSFWTFPFGSEFHPTTRGVPSPTPLTSVPFAVPIAPGGDPPPLLYSPTGRGSGPLMVNDFPWTDLVIAASTTDATDETAQNSTASIWGGGDFAAAAGAHSPVPAPQTNLFPLDLGPGGDAVQTRTPSFVDTSTSLGATPNTAPPIPQSLSDSPPSAGNPGGPDDNAAGGTSPADVPEPATLMVMLTSLLGLAALRRGQRA